MCEIIVLGICCLAAVHQVRYKHSDQKAAPQPGCCFLALTAPTANRTRGSVKTYAQICLQSL